MHYATAFPQDADIAENRISVLAPWGPHSLVAVQIAYGRCSILGLKTGDRRGLVKLETFCLHQTVRKHCVEHRSDDGHPATRSNPHTRIGETLL